MDPLVGFGIVLGILSGSSIYRAIKRHYRRQQHFAERCFGVWVKNPADPNDRFEHVLIEKLCRNRATALLAGQTEIPEQLTKLGFQDLTALPRPEYVIMGHVSSSFWFGDQDEVNFDCDEITNPFRAWAERKYPNAFVGMSTFADSFLMDKYQRTPGQILGEYYDLFGESPLSAAAGDYLRVRVTLDCHTADGRIVASRTDTEMSTHDDLLSAYRRLAGEFVEDLLEALQTSKPPRDLFSPQRLNEFLDAFKRRMNEPIYDQPARPITRAERVAADPPPSP